LSSPLKRGVKKWGIAFSGNPSETHIDGPGRSHEEAITNMIGFVRRISEADGHS